MLRPGYGRRHRIAAILAADQAARNGPTGFRRVNQHTALLILILLTVLGDLVVTCAALLALGP
jgi:hypothetical protein